jgi:hypothetical protein
MTSGSRALARAVVLAGLGVLVSATSRADTQACFDAALAGQKLQREGRLTAARAAFVACAQVGCPDAVAKQCAAWLLGATDALPSVTLEARDEDGRDLADVSVTVDGAPRPLPLEGRDVALDPGRHTFLWRRGNSQSVQTSIVLLEHEKGRQVVATFPSAERRSVPVATYALGGGAVVAGAVFGVLGVKGYEDRHAFGCDLACTSLQYSQVRREFVAADVSLGVAAAAVAGALWLLLSAHRNTDAHPGPGIAALLGVREQRRR